jgi:hypothetical protein
MELFGALGASALLALIYPSLFKETSSGKQCNVFILTMLIFSTMQIMLA